MALIELPDGYWIDISGKAIDYGKGEGATKRNISAADVIDLLREFDEERDEVLFYTWMEKT